MGFAEEMLDLGEKLVASCANRISNTKKLLNKFNQDHGHMAKELKNNLNEFKDNLKINTGKMLRRFYSEHKNMSKTQRENLRDFVHNLTHDVGGFLKKCHKEQAGLHNMFQLAHKNFMGCMREIERKKKRGFTPEESVLKRGRPKKGTRH